ncbi:amidohydrolase family protein [Kordiimonas pumila]|uniref:Amidohydrolase family protein n=1 Tax=Kordiimonas pumila TaxID=2161677 RepID=A0ABV7D0M1_9PROT|nr:amidohydrolase family protein [Kordiimonas pumila]
MKKQLIGLFLSACMVMSSATKAETYVVTNAAVFGAAEGSEPVSILLKDGLIEAVGPDVAVPENATVIDAAGRFVTSGLMNSATDLGLIEVNSAKETVDINGSGDNLGAAFDVQYGLNPNSILLDVARTEGLVRAAVMPTTADASGFAGMGVLLHLNAGFNILGTAKAMLVAKVGGVGASNKSRSAVWVNLYSAFEKAGKVEENSDAATKILQAVLAAEMPLVIDANRESDVRQAISFAAKFGIRVIILGGSEAWRVAPELAAAQIPVILNPYDTLPGTFDAMGARAESAAILHQAGVLVSFSVTSIYKSHNAGIGLRVGAGYAAARGLSKSAALDAITVNPAKIWGIDAMYGTLAQGKAADIVIWSGDPLEALTVADKVFIGGKPMEAKSRQMLLRDKYHPSKQHNSYPPAYQ